MNGLIKISGTSVDHRFWNVFFQFAQIAFWLFVATALISYFWAFQEMGITLLAQGISLFFVASNFLVVRNVYKKSHRKFYRQFLIVFAFRFILVTGALIMVLAIIKFQQIYFTVSFIISYILHSIIEIFSINQILQTDN